MGQFTTLPPEEIERRRLLSVGVREVQLKDAWLRKYQKRCDAFFWKNGPCCAGCDYWASEAGDIGECTSAPPVSGTQVLKSLGIDWSSYTPPPGQPFTTREHRCGAFQDTFDWSILGSEYLLSIGYRGPILTQRR